jgi:hypothetical protein
MQRLFLAQLAPRHEFKGRVENTCVANGRGERQLPATVCCSPLTESSTSQATLISFRPVVSAERHIDFSVFMLNFSPQKYALTTDKASSLSYLKLARLAI